VEQPNSDDLFVYLDPAFNVYGVFDSHGAYGHFISNLAYRLVIK